MKRILLASASVLSLASTAAHAQTASAPVTIELQEVIVTAQRVEQTAQRVPLAISVINPQELTRQTVTRAEDLTRVVPALVATNSGGPNTTFFLRGVGNFTVNAYSDPAIAFNYDGVYIGRPTSTSGNFYDLQRVEVLKGPQGTLYGRNATGGAINVIPNKPVLGKTGGQFQVSYGNYKAINTEVAVNLALGEKAALRLSGTVNKHDGYLSDGTSDQRDSGARVQILAEVTPSLTVRAAADYAHQGGVGGGAFLFGTVAFTGAGYAFTRAPGLNSEIGLHDPRSQAFFQTRFVSQAGRTAEPFNSYPYNDNDHWGVLAEINWETSIGTVTVEPAYRKSTLHTLFTLPAFRGARNDEEDRQASIEARLAGSAQDKLDYLFGLYYFDEDISDSQSINQFTLTPFQDLKTGTKSAAAFGKLVYHVTDALTLTAAGRYTKDTKKFDGISDNYILFCGNPAPPQDFCPTLPLEPLFATAAELRNFYLARGIPVSTVPLGPAGLLPPNTPSVLNAKIPINDEVTNKKFTYRLAAEYQLAPASMIYASVETGFHGGGFSFAKGLESYLPETITAYTAGSKNRFFDNRLQINVEAFVWKYKNQQFSQFGFDLGTPPSTVFYTSNVGRSTNKGVDIDVEYLATSTTRLSASTQYLDAKYDSFVLFTPNQGLPPNTNCNFAPVTRNGLAQFSIDCSGRQAFNAPKWAFNASIQQTVPLGDKKLLLELGTRYRSDTYVAPDYQPWVLSKADFQSNASVTLASDTDRWSITAFVNNIEDHRRLTAVQTNAGIGVVTGLTTPPRRYGVRLGARF